MASAWGNSWGRAWGNSWGSIESAVTGGKGDNSSRRKGTFKPTGLLNRPARKVESDVDRRVQESREIQAEVHAKVAREFGEETEKLSLRQEFRPVVQMSLREIDAEIALLLRKKLRTEDEEIVLLMLIAAAAAI